MYSKSALLVGLGLALAGPTLAQTPLTERTALERALVANFDLQVEALAPQVVAAEIMMEEAAFLPAIFAEGSYDDNRKSQNSIDFAALQQRIFEEENTVMRGGVGGRLPWGTTYELSLQLRELDNSVNRAGLPNALYSPEYDAFAGITLRQPLLKGFGRAANLVDLRVARAQLLITERTREIAVNNKCVEVLNAFYDLAYAESNVDVKTSAVSVADRFLAETDRRRELGLLSPVDVSEARVRVSEANEELIQARDFLRERQLEMVRLLSLPTGADGRTAQPMVSARLLDAAPVHTIAEFFPAALEQRPDYQLALKRVAKEGMRKSAASNERLPQLDLRFSYGLYGLSGDYQSAIDTAYRADEPQWGAGVSITVPLSLRDGRAKMQAASLRVRQAELRVEQLRQRIALEVENAVRRLEVLEQRLATARSSVSYATDGLNLEEARLENGQTSGFAVSELQRRLADARTRELAARVDLTKAVTELYSVSGRLLPHHGIEVAHTETERKGFNVFAPFDLMMK
ncbi:TolC family protein [Synoicihabitans lomoniglobus]|uniref:TolC family protein n=1 Tax=Synoicihabitans lomoniglobus TaxID=2909285 RepID=A0AAE9ZZ52_9BACT|nr:TolC family protein [Opitutaceae bacterium LMO-M01]WED65408.1 TolC family protein [Opitutaceae bacterium LMO-M01]